MSTSMKKASSDSLSVIVKNTFLEVMDDSDCDASVMLRPRLKTEPCDFGSKFWAVSASSSNACAWEDEDSTSSDVDTMSTTCSICEFVTSFAGRVWALSQDAQGCRDIQDMLGDEAVAIEHREALAQELRGHILAAAVCPYANYVLQKCVVALRPEAIQFIVDEIPASEVTSVAQNKFGCRVLQRLLERFHCSSVRPVVEAVLGDVASIAQSPYGNYVVQKLLECGGADAEQQTRLAQLLVAAVGELGAHPFGSIVISAALSKCSEESGLLVARAILKEPGLLVSMARARHGHRTVLVLLSMLEGNDLVMAKHFLTADDGLIANKFGRIVVASLRQV